MGRASGRPEVYCLPHSTLERAGVSPNRSSRQNHNQDVKEPQPPLAYHARICHKCIDAPTRYFIPQIPARISKFLSPLGSVAREFVLATVSAAPRRERQQGAVPEPHRGSIHGIGRRLGILEPRPLALLLRRFATGNPPLARVLHLTAAALRVILVPSASAAAADQPFLALGLT